MSRLFEALSEVEVKRHPPDVVPLPVASGGVVCSKTASPRVAQELEMERQSPEVGSLSVASAEAAAPAAPFANAVPFEHTQEPKASNGFLQAPVKAGEAGSVRVNSSPDTRLVALTNPNSLGAEKFRALVARLDYLRKQRELKSFQVISSVINEGKTLVAANLAVTFAKYSGSKTLLIEGDLHRPSLAALLGLSELRGLSQWWSGHDQELARFVHRLNDMPLWFLSAGNPCYRSSDILSSARFTKAFTQLIHQFEWIVVDSTPMLPTIDVNLWSKLLDGTLLVVREGLTPVKALKNGLQALDHPKLIGAVINEASGPDQVNYTGQSYVPGKP